MIQVCLGQQFGWFLYFIFHVFGSTPSSFHQIFNSLIDLCEITLESTSTHLNNIAQMSHDADILRLVVWLVIVFGSTPSNSHQIFNSLIDFSEITLESTSTHPKNIAQMSNDAGILSLIVWLVIVFCFPMFLAQLLAILTKYSTFLLISLKLLQNQLLPTPETQIRCLMMQVDIGQQFGWLLYFILSCF